MPKVFQMSNNKFLGDRQMKDTFAIINSDYEGSRVSFKFLQEYRYSNKTGCCFSSFQISEYLDGKYIATAFYGSRNEVQDAFLDLMNLDPKEEEENCQKGEAFFLKQFKEKNEWNRQQGYAKKTNGVNY